MIQKRTVQTGADNGIQRLSRRWFESRAAATQTLPPYENVMVGNLGILADKIVLISGKKECWTVMRTGRGLVEWLGREGIELPVCDLLPDCALALSSASDMAVETSEPYRAQANCARDGLVQRYDLFAMPLANRWGPPIVAVYVCENGPRYSLVDAIFRSTEEGVIALAAIRNQDEQTIDFQIVDLNVGAAHLLQQPIDELRWGRLSERSSAFNSAHVFNKLEKVVRSGTHEIFELTVAVKSTVVHLNVSATSMGDLVCVALTDVTDLKQRERSSRLLFENNPMPMWIFDLETLCFLNVNDAAISHYGYGRDQFLSMDTKQLWPADEVDPHLDALTNLGESYQSPHSWRHIKADGTQIEVLTFGRRIKYDDRDAYLVAVVDITEQKRAEARVTYLAHHDALTELPNRVQYHTQLSESLARRRPTEQIAVLCIDLDLFKIVNDSFGHPTGDKLLQVVADRLKHALKSDDLVARLGGDEFAIVVNSIVSPEDAAQIADRLINTLKLPYNIDGLEIVIGASIGLALAPADGTTADDLTKNADMALYRAKSEGRGAYHFFEKSMDEQLQKRRTMEADLRKALLAGELEVHYQPLVNAETGRVTSFESLLRWRHAGGFIPPLDFIPIAEATGLIGFIGEWVLRTACSEAATWPQGIGVAVNLSPAQFRDKNLVTMIINALAESGLDSGRLELEITESVLLAETDANLSTLRQLKALGIRISMDDFGTGYSSLSYLRSFPFDKIKIDRSFVKDIVHQPDSLAIIRAITTLGRSLGIKTTAEGVETPEQLACVRQEGCSEVQGYLFSAAKPANELAALIASINGRKRKAA
jgi:diguanylate cyclase (GGDEF)-like protein/PAS domain S-box-containing protein